MPRIAGAVVRTRRVLPPDSLVSEESIHPSRSFVLLTDPLGAWF